MSFLEDAQRVTREGILCLLELKSTEFTDVLRLVDDNDPEGFTLNGLKYTSFPFGFTPPSDQSNSASQIKLVISNVGRSITEELEKVGPNQIVTATVLLVDRKNPTVVAKRWRIPLSNVTVDQATATATCGNHQRLKQQAVRLRFDQYYAPGLF